MLVLHSEAGIEPVELPRYQRAYILAVVQHNARNLRVQILTICVFLVQMAPVFLNVL